MKSNRERMLKTKDNQKRAEKIQRKVIGLQQQINKLIERIEILEQGSN